MKRQTQLWLLAAATFLMTACSTDEDLGGKRGTAEAKVSAALGTMKARAVGNAWNEDAIGLTVQAPADGEMAALYRNVKYTTTASGQQIADFSPADTKIFFQDAAETVTFSAYAPYQASADAATLPSDGGLIPVNTEESNGSAGDREKIDFLYATGAQASAAQPVVSFTEDAIFRHRMARLDISLRLPAEADGLSAAVLGGLVHQGTFNAADGTATATGEALSGWDITDFGATGGTNQVDYSLIVLPQDRSTEGLTFSLTFNGKTYTSADPIAPNLEAGHVYTYILTVQKEAIVVQQSNIADWIAGPSQEGDLVYEPPIGDKRADEAQVGDFYFSDGTLADKDATLTQEQADAVIGIVFRSSGRHEQDTSPYAESRFYGGKVNGYVVALANAAKSERVVWETAPEGAEIVRVTDGVDEDGAWNDWNGYAHCQKIRTYVNANRAAGWTLANFPAAAHCLNYGKTGVYTPFAAPPNSSGWFLPSWAQVSELNSQWKAVDPRIETVKSRRAGNELTSLISDTSYFRDESWSSSEEAGSEQNAYAIFADVSPHTAPKSSASLLVRPILVF